MFDGYRLVGFTVRGAQFPDDRSSAYGRPDRQRSAERWGAELNPNRRGVLAAIAVSERSGTKVTFKPDSEIFKGTEFSFEILTQRLRGLSYLNRGLADPVARAPTDPNPE
jgi:hypothetical protein